MGLIRISRERIYVRSLDKWFEKRIYPDIKVQHRGKYKKEKNKVWLQGQLIVHHNLIEIIYMYFYNVSSFEEDIFFNGLLDSERKASQGNISVCRYLYLEEKYESNKI